MPLSELVDYVNIMGYFVLKKWLVTFQTDIYISPSLEQDHSNEKLSEIKHTFESNDCFLTIIPQEMPRSLSVLLKSN